MTFTTIQLCKGLVGLGAHLQRTQLHAPTNMCLTVFVINRDPSESGYRLILAFNRDEFYERLTKPAEFWERNPDVISGQDMFAGKEGGTWLGMSRTGRLAMLLNILEPYKINPDARGRGFLVSDFLEGNMDSQTYLQGIAKKHSTYKGFGLITMEHGENGNVDAKYYSNSPVERAYPITLDSGVHSFSNYAMKAPSPKTDYVRTLLEMTVQQVHSLTKEELTEELMKMMAHDIPLVSGEDISTKDMDLLAFSEILKELVFVKSNNCGTRTTTVILIDAEGNVSFTERTLKEPINPAHLEWEQRAHTFTLH